MPVRGRRIMGMVRGGVNRMPGPASQRPRVAGYRPAMTSDGPAASARLQGHAALLAVQLCFGLMPLFGKLAMSAFAPAAVAGWRILVGAAVLSVAAVWLHGRRFWPRRSDLLRLQACALLGVALNQVLYLEGLQRAPSVNAGVVMVLIPVLVSVLAVAVGQERLVPARAMGVALAAAGAGLLLLRRGPQLGSEYLAGNLLMMANAASYSLYLVVAKPLAGRLPPLVLIAWVFLLSVWTVPLYAASADWAPAAAGTGAWLSLAYVLAFPTVLAYLLNTVALARVPASTTAIYIFLQPLIAAAAGRLVLRESLDATFLAAAALIVLGLLQVRR